MDIAKIDENFQVKTNIEKENIKFYDVESEPFRVYGLIRENGKFIRMPEKIAQTVSWSVHYLCTNTAGGRVRFITDSSYVAISAEMDGLGKMPHFAYTGSIGFDVYADEGEGQRFIKSYQPPVDIETGFEGVVDLPNKKERIITLNLPLYSNVKKLYIGLEEGAVIKRAPDYKYEKPIVYYGSSITQGACASRPGNSYQAIISRILDCNYINLGFSGGAKGESPMVDYISKLDMKMLVIDYDYNAPSVEHLKETHEKMFKQIRNAQPNLPILMLTRPKYHLTDEEKQRYETVKATYDNAVNEGDKNVYFIAGFDLISEDVIETATVDDVHPNDSGFVSMANEIIKVIKQIL